MAAGGEPSGARSPKGARHACDARARDGAGSGLQLRAGVRREHAAVRRLRPAPPPRAFGRW